MMSKPCLTWRMGITRTIQPKESHLIGKMYMLHIPSVRIALETTNTICYIGASSTQQELRMPRNRAADFQILYVGEDGKDYERVPLSVNRLKVLERKTNRVMEIGFDGMPENIMCALAAAGMVRFMTMSLRNKRTPEGDKIISTAESIANQYKSGRLYIRDGSAKAKAKAIPPLDRGYYRPLFEAWLNIKDATRTKSARAREEMTDKWLDKMVVQRSNSGLWKIKSPVACALT